MPIFSSQLGKVESQTPEQGIKTLANHLRKLQEELEYRLMNLDSSNINEIDADNTSVLLGGENIQNVIKNSGGDYSVLEQNVKGLASTVSSQGNSISSLQQTATNIQTIVQDVRGNVSTMQQTVSGIQTKVENQAGQISTLQQTASALQLKVENMVTGEYTGLRMDETGVYIVDQDGKVVSIHGGQVDANTLQVNAANIKGTLTIGQLPSGLVTEGNVTTITQNAISTASIRANQITSGTINAGNLSLNGLLELKYLQLPYGYIGASDVGDTSGAVLCDSNMNNFFLATMTGAKMSYARQNEIWVASSGCHSTSTVTVYSDRRLKNNISYVLEDEEKLFMLFKPCSYQMINDKAGKKRWGFIAQDVIAGAVEVGMDAEKLAVIANHDGIYSLGYGEITALNTHMIQKLMERVTALEEARA